jgi:hypothetical protein
MAFFFDMGYNRLQNIARYAVPGLTTGGESLDERLIQ